jgi:hypothetical protein
VTRVLERGSTHGRRRRRVDDCAGDDLKHVLGILKGFKLLDRVKARHASGVDVSRKVADAKATLKAELLALLWDQEGVSGE